MEKGKYLCYYSDRYVAKLIAYEYPKKKYEVAQKEMNLAKKPVGLFGPVDWYKWTPEFYENTTVFQGIVRRHKLEG